MNAQTSSENLMKRDLYLSKYLNINPQKRRGDNYEEKSVINIANISNECNNACRMQIRIQ